jgi:hypothetical protein
MIKFKQIASVLAGTILASSTLAIAAAANYPAPFVDGGSADVAIVYGSGTGAVNDLLAVLDINNDLSDTLARNTASGGSNSGTRLSEDDIVQLDKTSDRLNLRNGVVDVFGLTVDEDDLPGLLADGQYTADDNDDFDYEQRITLANISLTQFRDSDYEDLIGTDDRTPTVGFRIADGAHVMNYTLDFLDQAESDIVSGDLDDIEGSDIPLLGKTYYVSDLKNGSNTATLGKLTLLDSAATKTVKEGETVTLTAAGVEYSVSIDFVDSNSAALTVNNEVSDDLTAGSTQKLKDGSYLGIREVRKLEVSGEVGSVEFSIGSGKLEITSGSDIKLNDQAINDIKGYVYRGTNNGGAETIDKIDIQWVADDDLFITPESEITIPGFEAVKFSMNELVRNDDEVITVENDGTDSIELKVPVKDGLANLNFLYANATGEFTGIGKASDERLATSSGSTLTYYKKLGGLNYHKNAVVTYKTTSDAESYVLSFTVNEDTTAGRNETTIKNEVTGLTVTSDRKEGDSINIGDVSFTISDINKTSTEESVVLTAGSNVNFNTVYSKGGLGIYLPYEVATNFTGIGAINFSEAHQTATNTTGGDYDTFYLVMDGENKDDDKLAGQEFNFTIDDNSDSELQVSQVNNAASGGSTGKELGDTDIFEAYILDDVAPRILHTVQSSGQNSAAVHYPTGDSETYAELFIGAVGTSAGTTGSTTTSSGGSVVSLGNVYFTDDETSKFSGKNLIVVGGSCVNRLASDLLGGAGCGPSFTDATGVSSGGFLIETFSRSDDKVATLVAGYDMGDTRNAAKVLTTGDIDATAGMKYRSTSATTVEMVEDNAADTTA